MAVGSKRKRDEHQKELTCYLKFETDIVIANAKLITVKMTLSDAKEIPLPGVTYLFRISDLSSITYITRLPSQ